MTQTDKELLELAAKAAGIGIEWEVNHNCHWIKLGQGLRIEEWNPIQDDAQALRLAVRLAIGIIPAEGRGDAVTAAPVLLPLPGVTVFRDDRVEATRRAIVMAAAEIQKSKEMV